MGKYMFSVKSNILSAVIVGTAIVSAVLIYTNASSKELERQIEAQERQVEEQENAEKQREEQREQKLDDCVRAAGTKFREDFVGVNQQATKQGYVMTNQNISDLLDSLFKIFEEEKDECYRRYSSQ